MNRLVAMLAVAGGILVGIAAHGGQTKPRAAQHKAAPATKKRAPVVTRSLMNPASLILKAPAVYKAKFITTKGVFVIQVTRAWAPLGADRFYNLVKYGFFANASFFRVISGFMVQFGISARPAVTAKWNSAAIQDDPVTQSNKRGFVTFATAGPNTRTTEVFINFADNAGLDRQGFSPFGQVIEGMDVVDKLYGGYGEGAPQGSGPPQDLIEKQGKPYLDKNFPKLDSVKSAVILSATPAHPTAAHHTAAAAKKPAEKKPAAMK